ncbi:hypothetical protein [Vannielia sp. SX4]|uniref:hypothetical protein n=1 Tax=Vannielia sp. SX4 TaxID=3463852 RepID=UPI004058ED7E
MQKLSCETFTQVMFLPERQRQDLLEFIGGSEVNDAEVQRLVRSMNTRRKPTTYPSPRDIGPGVTSAEI